MIEKILKEHNVIMLTKFGSHLYGTDTPDSDTDYKGIFMPTPDQILLGKIPKSINFDSNPGSNKNEAGDIDCELYSFHYFLELCCKGEMVAIDMLHANEKNIIFSTPLWNEIHERRNWFYTTDMKAFVGYARKQAAKYGLKGSRLNSAELLIAFLTNLDPESRMFEVWNELPTDDNMKHQPNPAGVALKHMMFNFCGKQIQSTNKVKYTLDMVQKFYDAYGHRAIAAKNNEGVDWKAMSHALRAGCQIKEIFQTGDLTYPLQDAELLRNIKQGNFDFEFVIDKVEVMLSDIEQLSLKSTLPKEVDRGAVAHFIKFKTMAALI